MTRGAGSSPDLRMSLHRSSLRLPLLVKSVVWGATSGSTTKATAIGRYDPSWGFG